MSNTQSPHLSVQWIDAAKAAHFHVSLNTLRPGLFRSPSSSSARNRHTCVGVYALRGACNMSIPSQTPSAESCCHLLHSLHCTESLTPHIQPTIEVSFRRSSCKSGAIGAQVSLPCNRAERTQALKTFPRVLRDTCLDVRKERSLLNFPQAVLHLVMMASLHPQPAF